MTSAPKDDDFGKISSEADAELQQQHSDSEQHSEKSGNGTEGPGKKILAVVLSLVFIGIFISQYPRFSEPFSHLVPEYEIDIAKTDLMMLGDTIRNFQLTNNALPASLDELDTPVSVGDVLSLETIEYRPSGVEFRLTAIVDNQRIVYNSESGVTSVSN